jgi:DNA-directed RNA polymerase subunit M/transcription elongation factor TFIIS
MKYKLQPSKFPQRKRPINYDYYNPKEPTRLNCLMILRNNCLKVICDYYINVISKLETTTTTSSSTQRNVIDPVPFSLNLERCIYNTAIKQFVDKNNTPDWCLEFERIYKDKVFMYYMNLCPYKTSNRKLLIDLVLQKIDLTVFMNMDYDDMFPEKYYEYKENYMKRIYDNYVGIPIVKVEDTYKSLVKCHRCLRAGRDPHNVHWTTSQRRSGDESATCICTCLNKDCLFNFKFSA